MSTDTNGGPSAALAGEGSPSPEVVYGGKTYRLGWPTQKAKEWFELLVAWYAERQLESLRPGLEPGRFAARDKELEQALFAGQHRTFGDLWASVFNGPAGMALFVASLLKEHRPSAPLAEVAADGRTLWNSGDAGVRRALAQVAAPFAKALADDAPDPSEEKAAKALQIATALLAMIAASPAAATD